MLYFQCDLAKEGLVNNAQQMDEFCRAKGFANWFETSAKENINIETSARFLISEVIVEFICLIIIFIFSSSFQIMKHTEQLQPRTPGGPKNSTGITVTDDNNQKPKTGQKCCGGGNDSGDNKS